jgi:outer membrane receptor protein involved in Fe transport
MGGVVRNIPTAPNLKQIEGKLQAGYSSTGGEGDDNTAIKGVINIPLIEDVLAIRAVAYQFDNSGYYKNIAGVNPQTQLSATDFSATAVNRDDVGSNEVTGARISALWQPIDLLSVNLSYLTQDTEQTGWGQADLDLAGGFSQARLGVRTNTTFPTYGEPDQQEGLTDDIDVTSLTIEYDLDWATVTSTTSLVNEDSQINRDLSVIFGSGYPFAQIIGYSADLFSEEVRLTSDIDGPWSFLVGLYYEEKETGFDSLGVFGGTDPALNGGAIFIQRRIDDRELTQQALFGELSYNVSDDVKFTVGARAFDYDRDFSTTRQASDGSLMLPSETDSSESDVSLKAGVEYTPSDDALLYATWSEGFRVGYPVAAETPARSAICDTDADGIYDGSNGISTGERLVESDFVENFELGSKLSLLNNRLTLNSAVYQINWDGIPIQQVFAGGACFAIANAGKAQSRGAEFDALYSLNENILLNFSTSYVDAELTQDAPAVGGSKGDRLPGSASVNASVGIEYDFILAGHDAYLRSDFAYVGGFYNNLKGLGTEAGDYIKLNVKAGMTFDQISLDLYVDNLTDEDTITWVDAEGFPNRGNRLQPRTVGLNVGYHF